MIDNFLNHRVYDLKINNIRNYILRHLRFKNFLTNSDSVDYQSDYKSYKNSIFHLNSERYDYPIGKVPRNCRLIGFNMWYEYN